FWQPGKAIINFDLSIYRKYAPPHGVNLSSAKKKYPVIFRSPDIKKYGSKQAAQYARLEAAIELNRESALESCFWGMFQIGGFNWRKCGCASIDEFYNLMNKSERAQLDLFAAFCIANDLVKYIRNKNWSAFSLRYNGPGYKRLRYDSKMAQAYKKYKKAEK
ncbi:MAG: N-acetylmuramidase family protein, partial [Muribaculaceae bacterium]|nr:N-acetylmuramidase family protein [Muribaculaceae bacterium]